METSTALTTTTIAPFHLPAGDGERIWITGDTVTIKASASETGGALSVLEVEAQPGEGPPPHVHDNEDELFYVIDGHFRIRVGDEVVAAGPGTFAWVPRGTVHRFSCVGERAGRMLVAFTPGGMDGFFREAGRPATDDGPAPAVDAAEIARTAVAAERYGLHPDWDAR